MKKWVADLDRRAAARDSFLPAVKRPHVRSLRQLIDCLYRQDIRPNSEELADVLWLALRIGELERVKAPPEAAGAALKSEVQTEQSVPGGAAEAGSETREYTHRTTVEQRLPLFAETAPTPALTADKTTMGARPLRTPAAPALPEAWR